ncbi:MAG: UbiX family flavin prenyltransferase [Candidatus Omnitrophica bacterium]|nr:UbiX family flavin prenyltransferase [Candidatus Omnitrophota bacterium]
MHSPIVALTGASGSVYGIRLLELLVEQGVEPVVIVSDAGRLVLKVEMGTDRLSDLIGARGYRVESVQNFASPIASGSCASPGMIIAPCSMGTVAAIAHGISGNLIHRAADVVLKERRKLIIVPRETPLHAGHLKNLTRLSELGALILPAMPAFYHRPQRIEDLVDSVVARILDHLGVDHPIIRRWGEAPKEVPLDDRL